MMKEGASQMLKKSFAGLALALLLAIVGVAAAAPASAGTIVQGGVDDPTDEDALWPPGPY